MGASRDAISTVAGVAMAPPCDLRGDAARKSNRSPLPRRRDTASRKPITGLGRMRHETAAPLVFSTRNRVAWRVLSMGYPPRIRRNESHGRRHSPAPHRDRPRRHGSGGPHGQHQVTPQYSPITAPPFHRSFRPPSQRAIGTTPPHHATPYPAPPPHPRQVPRRVTDGAPPPTAGSPARATRPRRCHVPGAATVTLVRRLASSTRGAPLPAPAFPSSGRRARPLLSEKSH